MKTAFGVGSAGTNRRSRRLRLPHFTNGWSGALSHIHGNGTMNVRKTIDGRLHKKSRQPPSSHTMPVIHKIMDQASQMISRMERLEATVSHIEQAVGNLDAKVHQDAIEVKSVLLGVLELFLHPSGQHRLNQYIPPPPPQQTFTQMSPGYSQDEYQLHGSSGFMPEYDPLRDELGLGELKDLC